MLLLLFVFLPIGGSEGAAEFRQGDSQENPRPWRRKILKDADANVPGIKSTHNVPVEEKKQGQATLGTVLRLMSLWAHTHTHTQE